MAALSALASAYVASKNLVPATLPRILLWFLKLGEHHFTDISPDAIDQALDRARRGRSVASVTQRPIEASRQTPRRRNHQSLYHPTGQPVPLRPALAAHLRFSWLGSAEKSRAGDEQTRCVGRFTRNLKPCRATIHTRRKLDLNGVFKEFSNERRHQGKSMYTHSQAVGYH